MEDFNKNWLLVLLVAVIFGALGFLVGRTTSHGGGYHQMKRMHGNDKDKVNIEVEVEGEAEDETIVKMDTIMKDDKQIIIKEVKKIKKK